MSVTVFRDDDASYLHWLSHNGSGFVVNGRRGLHPEYLVLHMATCTSISRYPEMETHPGGFTERDYIKTCSSSIEELESHFRRLRNHTATFSSVCSLCKPTEAQQRRAANRKRASKATNVGRNVETYRRYELVAAKRGGGYEGVAWKEKKKVHSCVGMSLEDVGAQLRRFVDDSLNDIAKQRHQPPNAEEYLRAFESLVPNLPDGYCTMLKAHYRAPERTITATQLAEAAGYSSYSAANLHYGNIGKALYEVLPTQIQTRGDGSPIYTSALATGGERAGSEEHWTWRMRPEVAYAIEQLGLAT